MRRTNDPELVRAEYADESRFAVRAAAWANATGPDTRAIVLAALAEVEPLRVLEVGCGRGELAERIAGGLGTEVVALDQSERMVALTRARGLEALVGDVQELPFPDASFDAAVAAWMLYHVPDVDRALAELARVLRPGGRLVAVTIGDRNLPELWGLYGGSGQRTNPFSVENGAEQLARRFARVDRRESNGTVTFADWEAARAYVSASVTRRDLADRLPRFEGALVCSRVVSVFVAETAP